jgi:hypothetical protein
MCLEDRQPLAHACGSVIRRASDRISRELHFYLAHPRMDNFRTLLIPQGHNRIDARRPARGNEDREQPYRRQDRGHRCER